MKTYRILLGASLLAVLGACGSSPTAPSAGADGRGSRSIISAPATAPQDTTAAPVPALRVNSDAATTAPAERDNGLLGSGVG
ncbi:hypothetical protein [Longimicrobium terrae]|uniref:Putative lipoprotein n=1 Tax=Longimicrobium terrae TaxID=1639882 RepID=A0A841GQL1_9BACT|nr:hypothetical protein [Longimicrobium terrae]MBB4634946.1 putative lipoprotein [Longimicrobium terrae]MBB6069340.1 putative lipoprotein [Longimicrobium terrae]NNC31851.1 hypothetical protein [Longimicrobium terrae]